MLQVRLMVQSRELNRLSILCFGDKFSIIGDEQTARFDKPWVFACESSVPGAESGERPAYGAVRCRALNIEHCTWTYLLQAGNTFFRFFSKLGSHPSIL